MFTCLDRPLVAAAVRLRSGVKRPQILATAIRQAQRGARVATAMQSIAAPCLGAGYRRCFLRSGTSSSPRPLWSISCISANMPPSSPLGKPWRANQAR
ncbi:hypothetical protein D3C72_1232190 [compost metagenome]